MLGLGGNAVGFLIEKKAPPLVVPGNPYPTTVRSPGSQYAFNELAEGIAHAAFQPGGITVFGDHYEAEAGVSP